MLTVISRARFGFRDDFEGYVFLKDGEYPVAQYHIYKDYNTFFWLGHATLKGMSQCLGEAIEEISRRQNEHFENLSSGVAQYASQGIFHYADFKIIHQADGPMRMLAKSRDDEDEFIWALNANVAPHTPISFARYDIESSLALPIILWADLNQDLDSEIGFSTTLPLPLPVLKYFQNTCRVNITDSELEDVLGHITDDVGDPVLV